MIIEKSDKTDTINGIKKLSVKEGCEDIGMRFIQKAILKHNNFYDYSLVKYNGCELNVDIICPVHGIFKQLPKHHIVGSGCKQCYYDKRHIALKCSTEEYIKKVNNVHKYFYDYSQVEYKNWKTNIKIICPKHGVFEQYACHHLKGSGCPKCYHFISKAETEWLDHLKILLRGIKLPKWKKKQVDGYDPITNTVYEFLGDYWHGNPHIMKFSHDNIHPVTKLTYGEMYNKTFKTMSKIKNLGYNVKYIWEDDWYKFIKGKSKILNIQTL